MRGSYSENKGITDVFAVISHADDDQISQLVRAVSRRFAQMRPDEEVMFLTLPKNDVEECERIIMTVLELLRSGGFQSACGINSADI